MNQTDPQDVPEATSLRAFSVDSVVPPLPGSVVDTPPPAEVEAEPVRTLRVPFGAKLLFGVVVGGCLVVLGLSAPKLRAELAAKNAARNARAAAAVAPSAPAPPVPAALLAPSAPVAAVAPPPASPSVATPAAPAAAPAENHPTTASAPPEDKHASADASKATIKLSKKGHTLKVDGKPVKGMSVDVACGKHLVAVDAEKPHRVEAACGQTVVVDDKKAHDDKKRDVHHGHSKGKVAGTASTEPSSAKAKTH